VCPCLPGNVKLAGILGDVPRRPGKANTVAPMRKGAKPRQAELARLVCAVSALGGLREALLSVQQFVHNFSALGAAIDAAPPSSLHATMVGGRSCGQSEPMLVPGSRLKPSAAGHVRLLLKTSPGRQANGSPPVVKKRWKPMAACGQKPSWDRMSGWLSRQVVCFQPVDGLGVLIVPALLTRRQHVIAQLSIALARGFFSNPSYRRLCVRHLTDCRAT
jgi:hypothetical protein